MINRTALLVISCMLMACGRGTEENTSEPDSNPITGTWKLEKAMLIENGDTTVTDYSKGVSFIKIINDTHFAFLQHDLNKGKDTAVFVAGGGQYTLKDNLYTEHLEYCSARDWEGNDFTFTITLKGDTLIQRGVENVESAGVNRMNIERYTRLKN